MENKFCFLKGIVECDSGRIQDCNNKRTSSCLLEQEKSDSERTDGSKKSVSSQQSFCYLKGLVDCSVGRVQDCNIKRVEQCPFDD